MPSRSISFGLQGLLALAVLALGATVLLQNATGVPAPKPQPPYALLFVPNKAKLYETTRNRRYQFGLLRDPSVLCEAIRSLKNAPLPSLPKKGRGEGEGDPHEEDVAWMKQNLKAEYLQGTGVLRISMIVGSRREQALLVNAVVQAYFRLEVDRAKQNCEQDLELTKKAVKMWQQSLGTEDAERKRKIEQGIALLKVQIKQCEDALRTLPRLLDLAEVPPE
jgi:hypothetical protein